MSWNRTTSWATVKTVEEKFRQEYVSGVGKDAVFKDVSIGWHVTFHEWPHSAIWISDTDPGLSVGDRLVLDLLRTTGELKC